MAVVSMVSVASRCPNWSQPVGSEPRIVPGPRAVDARQIAPHPTRVCQFALATPSHVPAKAFREVRVLTRYRRTLIGQRSRVRNRVQKVLDRSGVRVGGVLSDVFGRNGRRILDGLARATPRPRPPSDADGIGRCGHCAMSGRFPAADDDRRGARCGRAQGQGRSSGIGASRCRRCGAAHRSRAAGRPISFRFPASGNRKWDLHGTKQMTVVA